MQTQAPALLVASDVLLFAKKTPKLGVNSDAKWSIIGSGKDVLQEKTNDELVELNPNRVKVTMGPQKKIKINTFLFQNSLGKMYTSTDYKLEYLMPF